MWCWLRERKEGLEEVDDAIEWRWHGISDAPDLTEFETDNRCHLYERYKKLDILINNAGLWARLTSCHRSPGRTKPLAVNVTANWRNPGWTPPANQMQAEQFLTSTAGQRARAYWGIYAVSKAALEMMINTYAQEVKTQIRVNLLSTGTRTGMRAGPSREDPMTIQTPGVADQIVEWPVAPPQTGDDKSNESTGSWRLDAELYETYFGD